MSKCYLLCPRSVILTTMKYIIVCHSKGTSHTHDSSTVYAPYTRRSELQNLLFEQIQRPEEKNKQIRSLIL